ncbi:MAG: class I SAM-dependent methyltransferase [Treponema sp.]|jgi:ubiquinone/menaquinone biosynthesis C-methylase UbiE|nr:class I SAM-dependent methyltransferase [Treponema sp.]
MIKNTKNGNKSFWNRFAFLYDFIIKRDRAAYEEMYRLMAEDLTPDMDVLELAAGTGLIALRIAERIRSLEATDFSPAMIAEAKKKPAPKNVNFSVQDATALTYEAARFDAVIISNALHIMPGPALALTNIRRVLKPEGLLIAPTFTRSGSFRERLWAGIMGIAGFRIWSTWKAGEYLNFLRENGFNIRRSKTIPASFPLVYVTAKMEQGKPPRGV